MIKFLLGSVGSQTKCENAIGRKQVKATLQSNTNKKANETTLTKCVEYVVFGNIKQSSFFL